MNEHQLSRQFWAYLVKSKLIRNPQDFIMPLPHMSLVQGEKNVEFLKTVLKRFKNPLFQGMEFSDAPETLKNGFHSLWKAAHLMNRWRQRRLTLEQMLTSVH